MRSRKSLVNEIDLGRYELRRQGRRVKLEKKPMELLIFLVGRRDQLVSRQEIVAKLWCSNLFIETETNINNIVRKIRTALGDDFAQPRFLETVVGKGYRFVGPVRVIDARYPLSDGGSSVSRAGADKSGGWGERSSLAVLPLALLGKTTDDNGVCLGFADALDVRLGNVPGVDVLRPSVLLNVSPAAAPAETAARLGVRFLVRGAIQRSKGLWRLSMEMFDAHLQNVCFTRKRHLHLARLFELEDEIAKQIAMALHRPLGAAMVQGSPRYIEDPTAYADFMRGYKLSSLGNPSMLDEAARH